MRVVLLVWVLVFWACSPAPADPSEGSCGEGQALFLLPGAPEAECLEVCVGDEDCVAEERCFGRGGQGGCVPRDVESPECAVDADCGGDEVCADEVCVDEPEPECFQDADCGARRLCVDEVCVNEPEPECRQDSDCGERRVCIGAGVCTWAPDASCSQDSDCGAPCGFCARGTCEYGGCGPLCGVYCGRLYGACPRTTCGGLDEADRESLDRDFEVCLDGGVTEDGERVEPCSSRYLSDPQFAAQVDQFAAETCGNSASLQNVYCGQFGFGEKCDCVEPTIGTECATDDDCEGGTLNGICIAETDDNGEATGYVGGYCISGPCDAGNQMAGSGAIGPQTGCGAEGFCINEQTENGVASICYRRCSANTDCREGYACEILGFFTNGDPAGRCQPACATNEDCPVYTLDADPDTQLGSFCNTDGWCEIPCDPNEADSCGDSGRQACTARADFNADTDFTGSCELTP